MTVKSPPTPWDEIRKRAKIQINGESIAYTLCQFDARSQAQRSANAQNQSLDGNLIVYLPGHGQTAAAAKNLIAQILALSSAKVLWSIDFDPPQAGDPLKAQALIQVIHQKASQAFFKTADAPLTKVSLFGWSHGAAEAVRTVAQEPDLFEHVVCFCPAGMINRTAINLLVRFLWEALLIGSDAVSKWDRTIFRVLAAGLDIGWGMLRDLYHTRSLIRVINDIRWASRKAPHPNYAYDGKIIILFGRKDTVIRWQDVFPQCGRPNDIKMMLEQFKRQNFPHAASLQVEVLEGNHMAPEILAPLYVQTAFDLLD